MTVYVSEISKTKYGKTCLMMADSVGELNAMAKAIGLKIRRCRGFYPSYELRPSKRIVAIKKGAIPTPLGRMIVVSMGNRSKIRQWHYREIERGAITSLQKIKCPINFQIVKTNCGTII